MMVLIQIIMLVLMKVSSAFADTSMNRIGEKKYGFSICTLIQNQEKFLREWIEYHRLIGVEHFYLFDAHSTDQSILRLTPYIEEGVVTLIPWPTLSDLGEEERDAAWSLGIKIPAFEYTAKFLAAQETSWLLFLDVNEFLLSVDGAPLSDLLKNYVSHSGVELEVVHFDASRLDSVPPRELVIQTNLLSKPFVLNPLKCVTKVIFQPEHCAYFQWPPYRIVFKGKGKASPLPKSIARINSYRNRFNGQLATEAYRERMDISGLEMTDNEIESLLDAGYEIEDPSCLIFNYVPTLLEKMRSGYGKK